MNPPNGSTYSDPPPLDASTPGAYGYPTLLTDRTQTIIDPETGLLIRRVTLPDDSAPGLGANFYDGGFMDACASVLVNGGYHCSIPTINGEATAMYWINPSTGESRFLGRIVARNYGTGGFGYCTDYLNALWDSSNPNVHYCTAEGYIVKGTYTGGDAAVAQQTEAAFTWTRPNGATTLGSLIQAYDVAFNPAQFNCEVSAVQSHYLLGRCRRGTQESITWLFVYDLNTTTIIAAQPTWKNPACRWCADHADESLGNVAVFKTITQALDFNKLGSGPYNLTLVGSLGTCTLPCQSTITVTSTCPGGFGSCVTGDPVSPNDDKWLMGVQAGDYFRNLTTGEWMQIVTKISPTSLVVQRGVKEPFSADTLPTTPVGSYNDGTQFTMMCGGGEFYWRFLDDPRGTDATGAYSIMERVMYGAHEVSRGNYRIQVGYSVVAGGVPDALNHPISFTVPETVSFAGGYAPGEGNTYQKHQSYMQINAPDSEKTWFLDTWPLAGGPLISPQGAWAGVLVGGTSQVYKYTPAGDASHRLDRKRYATFATTGDALLKDISGPGSLITDSTSYTYCVAVVANECRSGSAPGDVYISAPNVTVTYCSTSNLLPVDLCLHNVHPYSLAATQFGLQQSTAKGEYNRVLTKAWHKYQREGLFSHPIALPDGSWALISSNVSSLAAGAQVFLVKLPPRPVPDGLDRSTFTPTTITIPPAGVAGVDNAVVEFGYQEQGSPTSYYCTSRAETCVTNAASVNATNPFAFKLTEQVGGVPCASGCTIAIPAIPQRVAYWSVKYRDAAGSVVAAGPEGVAVEGTFVSVAGGAATVGGASSISIISSPNPSVSGQPVTFTATVGAGTSGTPTGTITFTDGVTILGTGTLNNGQATLSTSTLSIGSHSITAQYDGGGSFGASTSGALMQTVAVASTGNKAGVSTTVTSSANPTVSGQSVTFTATVAAATTGTPTGTVTFMDGTTTLGTGTLNSGQATFSTSTLSVASHSITVQYGGDSNFNTSMSAPLAQTVNKAAVSTSLASSANPSVSGQSVTFTATVTPATTGTPAGTVTFKDGVTTLGTGTLDNGKAAFSTSALSVASHSITASYSGDSNFNSSTSAPMTQLVNTTTTTTTTTTTGTASAVGNSTLYPKPYPAPTLPAAGKSYVDPTFGTTIVRVTDQVTAPGGAHLNSSSSDSMFNSSGTMFYVHYFNAGTVLYSLDRTTARVTLLGSLPDTPSGNVGYNGAAWDPANPNVLYAIAGSTTQRQLWQLTLPLPATMVLLHDFSAEIPSGGFPSTRVQVTPDGRYFAILASTYGAEGTYGYVAVWDRQTGTSRVLNALSRTGGPLQSMTLDNSGQYAILQSTGSPQTFIWQWASDILSDAVLLGAPDYFGGDEVLLPGKAVSQVNVPGSWAMRSLATPHSFSQIFSYPRKNNLGDRFEDSDSSRLLSGGSFFQSRFVDSFQWGTFALYGGAVYKLTGYLALSADFAVPEQVRYKGVTVSAVSTIPTAPNQWFYDVTTDTLYVWLPDSSNPQSNRAALSIFDWRPLMEEIVQVLQDSSGAWTWRRLAQHRNQWTGDGWTPLVSSDPAGSFALFQSNWDGSSRNDVFLLQVPPLSTGGGSTSSLPAPTGLTVK
jgi:hypothetical protein